MKKLLDSIWFALALLIFSIVAMVANFSTGHDVRGWIWFGLVVVDTGLLVRAMRLEANKRD